MQKPFPVLTRLYIYSKDGNVPVLPGGFFGGSAPCLQEIRLYGIPFPALSTLLLSASDLVKLSLLGIPPTGYAGYISPEEIVASLAALPRLKVFAIEFQLANSRPDRIHPPPITRTVLPVLTSFRFCGSSEYLEDLVAQIDSPQLDQIEIKYFRRFLHFQVAQFSKFIDRSVGLKITPSRRAHVTFFSDEVSFNMYRHANHPSESWDQRSVAITISCKGIGRQVSQIARVLSHISVTLSVVHLYLDTYPQEYQLEGTDNVEWQHLLHQFSTAQTLHVSRGLAWHFALALEDITGEMAAEVLPSLDLICLGDPPPSSVEKFVAVRRLSGRPITVVGTWMEFDKRLKSYVSE